MSKRVFMIVLDSLGIGELPDAGEYGDEGSNTLKTISISNKFHIPHLENLGIFNIDGNGYYRTVPSSFTGSVARMCEASKGKDTTIGHWEIAGIISSEPMPVFPNGFSKEIIQKFEQLTGRKVICNKPYSGTAVINDYGKEHIETGALIVYTSADSVFQIAAHEDVIPISELYQYCAIARKILDGQWAVGRVIARPFNGKWPNFQRTPNRHDFSLNPPRKTFLEYLMDKGLVTIGVGKINDIFAGQGISISIRTKDNIDGMNKAISIAQSDFSGICFVNLVDFDMKYGHRNDIDGYANALSAFDGQLNELKSLLRTEDIVIITADHGCDPGFHGTDHSRIHSNDSVWNSCKGGF